MKIKDMFKNDINRDINGVIKMNTSDEEILKQELEEYVVTKELRKHFSRFYDNYAESLDKPTDKMGVWISGFFGSGKSHFLKMLSFLLSNKEIAGKPSIEYFRDKFEDPMMFSTIERCAKIPTQTILFDIDSIGSIDKNKTVILRVFAKVFYDCQGFYGDDLKVAKLEKQLSKAGKYEEFKNKFEEIHGDSWLESRDAFSFYEDDIVDSLVAVGMFSDGAARNWFNGNETNEISINQLTDEIKEYIDSKGKDFRLIFMIDEVGQYIGSDVNLMLNLQTIVQDLGVKCRGRVWVMVTSQEDVDSIIKVVGNDFSKIQGRFDTRLSLSSSSVDEVIKKRILAKDENATDLLKMMYEKNSAVLKNLYAFTNSVQDIKGFASADDFAETYPFIPYQSIITQKALTEIRKHGNSGKHLSDGSRTMLANYKDAAVAMQNKDENALAPFYLFFDSVSTFLEGSIRRVVDRCQRAADANDGILPEDVNVLKLLYLIRYIEDFKSNIENIAILMIDDIRVDKINLKNKVKESLDRLLSQNYIARNGDCYSFLTDDEQDIAREINNTQIDTNKIVSTIGSVIFGDLYPAKKYRYDNKYDFDFDKFVDETPYVSPMGGMKIKVLTQLSDLYSAGENTWRLRTSASPEAWIVLSDEYDYFEDIQQSIKIRTYVKTRNVSTLPTNIQQIIRAKSSQASSFENEAKDLITKAFLSATFVVCGEKIEPKGSTVKDKMDYILSYLTESVYKKLDLIKFNYLTDDQVYKIINPDNLLDVKVSSANEEAVKEINDYLKMQQDRFINVTMKDIQNRFGGTTYGWREIDIAACVAELIASGDVSLVRAGTTIANYDKHIVDYLRKKTEVDKIIVAKKVKVSDKLLKDARDIMKEYLNIMDVPTKEDDLAKFIIDTFESQLVECEKLKENYKIAKYPQEYVVDDNILQIKDILNARKDNTVLFGALSKNENDLYDLAEDLDVVKTFFKSQVNTFDKGRKLVESLKDEMDYFKEQDLIDALNNIKEIIEMDKPYRRISEIPSNIQLIEQVYEGLLKIKKEVVVRNIQNIQIELQRYKTENNEDKYNAYHQSLTDKIYSVDKATKLTNLDATNSNLYSFKEQAIENLVKNAEKEPAVQEKIVKKSSLLSSKALTKDDIEPYLDELRQKLLKELSDSEKIHII